MMQVNGISFTGIGHKGAATNFNDMALRAKKYGSKAVRESDFFQKTEKELNKIKDQIGVSQEIDRFERDLLETKKGRELYQKNRKV